MIVYEGTREMAQQQRALATFAEGLELIPSTYRVPRTPWQSQQLVTLVPGDPTPSSGILVRFTNMVETYMQAKDPYTQNKKKMEGKSVQTIVKGLFPTAIFPSGSEVMTAE